MSSVRQFAKMYQEYFGTAVTIPRSTYRARERVTEDIFIEFQFKSFGD